MIGYIKLKCCQNFHKSCIKEWFKIKQSCPLCREEYIDEITKLIEVKNRYKLNSNENIIFEYKYFKKMKNNKYNNGINKIIFL